MNAGLHHPFIIQYSFALQFRVLYERANNSPLAEVKKTDVRTTMFNLLLGTL